MGKVQNWVSLAQIRLDAAKTDLNSLHRELISRSNELASRDCEIANLRTQLIDSEVIRGAYEKTQTENVQRSGGTMPNPSTMNFVPSREPMPIGALPTQAGDIPLNPSDRSAIQSGIASSPTGGLFAQSGGISLDPSEHPVIQSGIAVNPTGALPTQPRGMPLDPSERSAIESGNASTLDPKLFQPPIRAGTMQSEGPMSEAMSARPGVTAPGTIDQQYSGDTKDELAYTKSQQAGGFTGSDHPSTVDAAVQSGKGRERSKRESQLESELSRLRKENEKITKERTDYENAIQRALLRGVSSLNAETLKVLRCSPVGCYTPCGPPPSPVNTLETMIPCVSKKTRDNWTPRGCRTTTNASSRVSSTRVRPNVAALPEQENNCCAAKRPSTANYGSFSRHKKSPVTSDPSMVFLLHQADASSVCISGNTSQIRPGGRTKSRKLETSVCVKKLG